MPESMDALHFHIADVNTRLRGINLQMQSQVNQSLYTHALAIQQNEHYLISRMQLLERRVREQALTIAELHAQEAASTGQTLPARAEEPGMPPELYLEFEASFRGSKDMIRERLKANLGYFRDNAALFSDPVLDLGCGRGEWLQLLKEEGIRPSGSTPTPP
jgi:O-antigen chain-terminating methyltransferase